MVSMMTNINKIKISVLEEFFLWQEREIKAQSFGKRLYCQAKMDTLKKVIREINKIQDEDLRVGKQDKATPQLNTAIYRTVGSEYGN